MLLCRNAIFSKQDRQQQKNQENVGKEILGAGKGFPPKKREGESKYLAPVIHTDVRAGGAPNGTASILALRSPVDGGA